MRAEEPPLRAQWGSRMDRRRPGPSRAGPGVGQARQGRQAHRPPVLPSHHPHGGVDGARGRRSGRSRRGSGGGTCAVLGENKYQGTDPYLVPFFDENFRDCPRGGGRNGRDGLFALDFEHRLVLLDLVSHLDEHRRDDTRIRPFTEAWQTNIHDDLLTVRRPGTVRQATGTASPGLCSIL
jgi:hypothetical protein